MFQKKENLLLNILLGALLAFTVHLRSIGQLLIIVYIIHKLFIEKPIVEFKIKEHKSSAVTLLSFLILYFTIKTIWPCNTNYPSLFETENFWLSFNDHLSYNIHHLSFLFKDYSTKNFYSIGIVASSAIVVFALTGMFHFYKLKSNLVYFYYFLCYSFIVFAFKLSHQGLRLLYPVLFFILLFAIFGIKKNLETVFTKQKWLAVLFGILLLYSYRTKIERIKNQTNDILDGPFKKESQEVFSFINSKIPKKV